MPLLIPNFSCFSPFQINKEDSFRAVTDYLDTQFERFLQEELKIKRNLGSSFHDTRVHACLYFVTPNGHGLKSIDLVCMKKLDSKVNIIPVIAKADTINKKELQAFKVNDKNALFDIDFKNFFSKKEYFIKTVAF